MLITVQWDYSHLCPFGLTKFNIASDYFCNVTIPDFFWPNLLSRVLSGISQSMRSVECVFGAIEQHQVENLLSELIVHLGCDRNYAGNTPAFVYPIYDDLIIVSIVSIIAIILRLVVFNIH
jgi:hypothetical protein